MCGLRSCSHWCYGLEYFVDNTTLVQIHSVQVCHTMGHKGGRIKLCTPSDFYSYCRLDYHTYTSAWPPLPLSCLSAGESVAGVSGLFRLLSRTWCNHEQVSCAVTSKTTLDTSPSIRATRHASRKILRRHSESPGQ